MTEHVDIDTSGESAPEDVFSLLTDGIRIEIIHALGHSPGYTASFSTLQERVGVDDSGRFNYHLQKLSDHFIRRTDEGYTLRYAGRLVHRAILSGAFTKRQRTAPVRLQDLGTRVLFRRGVPHGSLRRTSAGNALDSGGRRGTADYYRRRANCHRPQPIRPSVKITGYHRPFAIAFDPRGRRASTPAWRQCRWLLRLRRPRSWSSRWSR